MRSGGSLLIAAGTSAGGRSQIPIFGAHIIETRDYSRVPDRYMAVGSSDSSYPAVAKAGGWPGVKFFYALDVDPGAADAARVIVRLGDQTPLLLEKRIGEGRVVLLTSGLDNLTNDFPLNPAFVPFIEQTARYLAGSERQGGARPVDAYLELRNAREQAQGVEVTDPEGKRPLTLGEAASAQSFQLTEAGYYQLRLANGRQDEVGVNPDPKESNLDVIPDDVLALWQGKGGQSSQEASAVRPGNAQQDAANLLVVRHAAGARFRRCRIGPGQPLPRHAARGIVVRFMRRQIFQIRQILRSPAGRLVLTSQTDHRNHYLLDLNHLSFGITRFELDSRNGSENLNPNGRHPHANHVIPGKKQSGPQLRRGEPELAKRALNFGGVLRTDVHPNIEIVGSSDITVNPDRVPANQQVFNAVRVERLQELFEVPTLV